MIFQNSENSQIEKITNLNQLLKLLPQCTGQEYVEVTQGMELDDKDFEPYAFWKQGDYTRNCIDRSPNYELILLCWEEGVETPIHCHNGEECWVYGVGGTLEETRFDFNTNETDIEEGAKEMIYANSLSYMNDNMGYHKIANLGQGRAMTLHLYINPIEECQVWVENEKSFIKKELAYDTFKGEIRKDLEEKLSR